MSTREPSPAAQILQGEITNESVRQAFDASREDVAAGRLTEQEKKEFDSLFRQTNREIEENLRHGRGDPGKGIEPTPPISSLLLTSLREWAHRVLGLPVPPAPAPTNPLDELMRQAPLPDPVGRKMLADAMGEAGRETEAVLLRDDGQDVALSGGTVVPLLSLHMRDQQYERMERARGRNGLCIRERARALSELAGKENLDRAGGIMGKLRKCLDDLKGLVKVPDLIRAYREMPEKAWKRHGEDVAAILAEWRDKKNKPKKITQAGDSSHDRRTIHFPPGSPAYTPPPGGNTAGQSGQEYSRGSSVVGVSALRTDGGTQPRASQELDEATVMEYVEAIHRGDILPPVRAMWDGSARWLYDGFHRLEAHKRAGQKDIRVESRNGTLEDARVEACAQNRGHGLKRTTDDKRRAIETVLALRPEWTDGKVADHVGVDPKTVAAARDRRMVQEAPGREIPDLPEPVPPAKRVGRDGKMYPAPQPKQAPPKSQPDHQHEPTATRTAGYHEPAAPSAAPSRADALLDQLEALAGGETDPAVLDRLAVRCSTLAGLLREMAGERRG